MEKLIASEFDPEEFAEVINTGRCQDAACKPCAALEPGKLGPHTARFSIGRDRMGQPPKHHVLAPGEATVVAAAYAQARKNANGSPRPSIVEDMAPMVHALASAEGVAALAEARKEKRK